MGQRLISPTESQPEAERSEKFDGIPKHRPDEFSRIVENRGGGFAQGGNVSRATMKNRNSLIGWELLLLFASVLVFRSVWLLLDEMNWARGTNGLLALLFPGVVLCIVALRAIHSDK
jgi:hypothetical protein